MDPNRSNRRRFLKETAALAGAAAGAGWAVTGQSAHAQHEHGDGESPRRGARYRVDHMTHYTPLQDYAGIITPVKLHFMQQHSSEYPEIDLEQHRVTIHGMVDRPLSFSMEDLKRLPSVSRMHFLECHGNSSPAIHGAGDANMGLPVQFIHGMTSCSEWSGVLLSVLLNEAGVHKGASWLVSEGGDAGKFSHTLPLAKAMEDVIVAYGQNGEPLRVEQGYPIRLVVPGWEAPFSIKYLTTYQGRGPALQCLEREHESFGLETGHWRQSALVPFPVWPEVRDYTAFSGTQNARPWIFPDYRPGVVRCGSDHQGGSVHERRPELEGSEASWAGASEGAYPVYV